MFWFSILILLLKFLLITCDLTKDQIETVDLPPKGFGNFATKIRYIEQCSDSDVTIDPTNANEFKFWATKVNEIDEGVSGYCLVKNDYRIAKAKFTPLIFRNGVMVPTMNRTTTTPCIDLILSFPLKLFFSPDDKCGFKKDNYTIDDLNVNKYVHMFAGVNFLYGRIHVIVEYFSDVGRTFCLIVVVDIRPVPKIKKKRKPKVP